MSTAAAASPKRNIYIQCNPLLDVSAEVDQDFLQRHHLRPDEELIYNPSLQGIFEELKANGTAVTSPGGAGLNTARVAQWLLTAHFAHASKTGREGEGVPCVYYVGCVGNDSHGDDLRAQAAADGVRMCLEVTNKAPTGLCAVCKLSCTDEADTAGKEEVKPSAIDGDGGRVARSLVADLGAAKELSSAFLSSRDVQAALDSAAVVYTNAYSTPFHAKQTLALAAATRAGDGAAADRPVFSFGLSSKSIMDVFGEDLVDLLHKMDIIFGNADEMRDLAAMLLWDPEEPLSDAELALKLATEMMYDRHTERRVVVVTRGHQPVLFATSRGEAGEVAVAAEQLKCFSTGAGDALVGGFLAAHVAGFGADVRRCVAAGVRAAAHVVRHQGVKALEKEEAPSL